MACVNDAFAELLVHALGPQARHQPALARTEVSDEALAEIVAGAGDAEAIVADLLKEAREAHKLAAPERARLDHENQVALVERLDTEGHELARPTGSLERAGEQDLRERRWRSTRPWSTAHVR